MRSRHRNTKLDQGTQRWKDLHDCLKAFAQHGWAYLVEVDRDTWDPQRILSCISDFESDLRLAEQIWPEGKPVLTRLAQSMATLTQFKEEEHVQTTRGEALLRGVLESKDIERKMKELDLWKRAALESKKKREQLAEKIADSCDEIKTWTSIDVRKWLEAGAE